MKEKIREYFTFTRKERLGVIVLVIIILILFIVPYWIRRPPGTEDPAATRQFAPLIEKLAGDSADYRGYGEKTSSWHSRAEGFSGKDRDGGRTSPPVRLFYFDPNLLGENEWQKLGLSERQSRTLVHYTGKGGRFRSAADLGKIYGLSAADRERLIPYVRIGSRASPDKTNFALRRNQNSKPGLPFYAEEKFRSKPWPGKESNPERKGAESEAGNTARYRKKIPAVIDINRSDSSQWEQLPGIGEKLATRIIRFREKLGGFYCVGQVAETFGLPDSTFQKIRPWLQSDSTAIRHIDLNTVSEISLRQHPYIRWKLASVLLRYREQHGRFQSVDELSQVALLDAETLRRLRPYLDLSQ